MTKDRLAAFTDAVIAIIMTILVLELEKPSGGSLAALWALRKPFAAYVLTFWWLGSFWIAHHNMWHDAEQIDNAVVWWSMLVMFFLSLVPYTTSFVSENFDSATAQGFYGMIIIASTFSHVGLNKALGTANADVEGLKTACDTYAWLLSIDCIIKTVGFLFAVSIWPPAMMLGVILAAIFTYRMRDRWGIWAK